MKEGRNEGHLQVCSWFSTQLQHWACQPKDPLGGTLAFGILKHGCHILLQQGDVPTHIENVSSEKHSTESATYFW